MAGKSRQSANLTSKNNIFVDAVVDNTGIGTTSPKSKLDVVGNARISGILTVGVSSSVTIDGNAGIVSATKLYAAGIDVSSFIAGAGYANTSGIATYALSSGISTISSGLATDASVNTIGIITASRFVGSGSSLTGVIGLSTQWISTSAGIHTLSNVGIGTTNPISKLTVEGGGINVRNTTSNSFLVLDSGIGPATGNQVSFIDFKFNGDLKGNIAINEALSTTPLEINSAVLNDVSLVSGGGKVGIGTTNAGAALDVLGSGLQLRLTSKGSNPGYSYIQFGRSSTASQNWHFGSEGNQYFNIWNGNFGSGIGPLISLYSPGSTTSHSVLINYGFNVAPTGTPNQPLQVNGGSYISGNVGIGTINPTSKLQVVGNVIVSGIITASSFVGNLTGTATTSSGLTTTASVNTSGIITASSFVGNLTGTATTAVTLTSDASVNTSGIVTATKFVGDGSGLSGIVAAGSGGITLQNDSNPVGTAGTINFDNNFDLEISGGIATVTLLTAPGLTTNASVNTTGIITASNFIGTFTGNFVGSGSSLTGVIGLSTQWITTSAGIHTLSRVGIGTTNPLSTLEVFGNVNVAGTSGQLFSVVDNLATGSIFSVNDISGIPSIDVDADGTIELAPFNGTVGVGTTRPRARVDVIGTLWASNISVGVITATTFSGNLVTLVNGRTGIVSIGIVSMTDFLYQPQGVVTLTDRWDSYNAINSSGGWDLSSANSLTIVRLNWVPSSSQNGTSGSTWRTNFLDKVKAGDLVQWSKDGITWNSFIQPFDSVNTGSNSVGFYPGSSVPINGSMYVRYITTKATGNQPLQNGQILQFDSAYSRWMPFGPYANWESTSAGINTLRNVGIGTTRPESTLHISSTGSTRLIIEADSDNITESDNAFIIFRQDGGLEEAAIWKGNNVGGNDNSLNIANTSTVGSGGIRFFTQVASGYTQAIERMSITNIGNIGVGSTNPTSRFDVGGNIKVTGIVTASSFIGTTFIGNLIGTATTATALTSNADINTTGILTATKFVGDGSGLTGIVATSSGGIFLQNNDVNIGAASTINFTNNFVVESAAGIATVGINTASTITAAAFIGDGSGLTNVSGGGGASSRTVVSGITTEIPVNGIGNTEISGFKTYGILKVGLSTAAWIRLYTDSISRDNDANRSISNDPTPGSGLVAEVATAGLSTVKITPFTIGFNDDTPVTNTIYISVRNLSGIATNITFDLTILKLED